MIISSDNLSVIIPVYNEEKNVINILQSLECQSLTGFNVIVIDDGSKDMTASLVKEYKPSSYSLSLIQQSNMGLLGQGRMPSILLIVSILHL